jgi:hypothetical protein
VSKALCGSSVAAIALILIALATAFSFEPLTRARSPQATNAPAVVEHGKFMLHKMEQPLGEETFETTRSSLHADQLQIYRSGCGCAAFGNVAHGNLPVVMVESL